MANKKIMSSRQITKSQVKRIARKKANEASLEVKGQILGTSNSTDLDTLAEIQNMLEGDHDNENLNVLARTTKGESGSPQIFSGHNKFENNIQVAAGVQFQGNATTATSASKLTRDSSVETTGFVKVTSDGTFTVNDIASGDLPDSIEADTSGSAGFLETGTGAAITFKPEGTTRMTLTTAGNLGIGTESPSCPLHVEGAGGTLVQKWRKNTGTGVARDLNLICPTDANQTNPWRFETNCSIAFELDNIERMRIDQIGRVGIGTESPGVLLHINGTGTTLSDTTPLINRFMNLSAFSTYAGDQGNVVLYANNSIVTSNAFVVRNGAFSGSDSRIKTNIQDLDDESCLEKVNLLKPKRYKYVDVYQSGHKSVVGFIAQEVKEILPEAVMERTDYIPNIYQTATITDNILRFETNLSLSIITNASGGKIKIFDTLNKEYFIDISSATSNTLTMSDVSQLNEVEFYESNKVFVFGEEVADFHLLKKEMILPIAVGAIQELDRIQIKQSEEIVKLKKQISGFEDPTFKAVHEQDISTLRERHEQTSLEFQTAQDGNLKVHETFTSTIAELKAAQAELKAAQAAQQLLHQDHVDSLESEIAIIRSENEALMNENVTLRGANAAMLEKQTDLLEQQTTQSENQTLLLKQQVTLMDQNASNEQRLLKMERTSNTLLLHQLRVVADRVAELEKKCAPSVNDAGDEGSG